MFLCYDLEVRTYELMSSKIENFDVGPSRDGDQFHYSRASRLCLELLEASSDLKVVSVEGISKKDTVHAGIESIDLALYYGSDTLSTARLVRYRQLKHSTLQAKREWTASGLRKTLKDFADRFRELVRQFGVQTVCKRFVFEFETNRPFSPGVEKVLGDLRQGAHGRETKYISQATGLSPDHLQAFASLFTPITCVEGFLEQRALLSRDLRAYLPDNDKDAAIALRELVARKATSEFKSNHEIRREDVLDVMGARLDDLFPATNALEIPSMVVPRVQMPDLIKTIIESSKPIIVSADGGYGKSVVASQIGRALPGESFVYDCFGNGGYRSATGLRHRAKDGLVQLANEMAVKGLCHPLIPTPKADDAAYVRAFLARVFQASAAVLSRDVNGYLVLIVDAADNAEMAAEEFHHSPSFPRLLLAESFPENVRLVFTARPHRVSMLEPPLDAVHFALDGFTEKETEDLLRIRFPGARNADVREFHRLTSSNPRVQRTALDLEPTASLATVLRSLGPAPRTVNDTIAELLERAVKQARHVAGSVERPQIDLICEALATLRPFVPISIIASTAGVSEGLVRSFVLDLGRPLLLRDESVQFRDEPTETWFQERFKPQHDRLEAFVHRLKPLARGSHYAASALPALLLSTDRFDELVKLALSDDALPEADEIARRDVELQRLEFATLAALRARRYADAARLALKAGGRAAADNRQQLLLSANVDLASRFLDSAQVLEQVSRHQIIGGAWTGSEHAYEAALLSGKKGLDGEARAQLRIAYDWIGHWLRNVEHRDHRTSIDDNDILELMWAELNIHGPARCAAQLRRWRPRQLSYRVGRLLLRRLVDASRWHDVQELTLAARNDIGLILAAAGELKTVNRHVPEATAVRTMRLLLSARVHIAAPGDWQEDALRIAAIASAIDTARFYKIGSKRALASLLRRYLPQRPPHALESEHLNPDRIAFLRAYALLASLSGKALTLDFVYGARRGSKKGSIGDGSFRGRAFANLRVLLPWHELKVKVQTGAVPIQEFSQALSEAQEQWTRYRHEVHQDWSATADEVVRLWSECIVLLGGDEQLWSDLVQWQESLRTPLFIPTLADIARRVALTGGPKHVVFRLANKARGRIGEDAELAESMADSYVLLARAVQGASEDESKQYFNEAVRVASKIGQENLERWHALLHLGDACAPDQVDEPQLAYRFARAAELTRSYVDRDKHFDWEHTVEAVITLSPRTSPAIMSRWRDRRFGEPERFFPQLVEALCRLGHLDARDALALIPFEGRWKWSVLIANALDAAGSSIERENLLTLFFRYLRFSACTVQEMKDVADAVQKRGLNVQRILELIARSSSSESDREPKKHSLNVAADSGPKWNDIFAEIDLTNATDLLTSRARMPGGSFGSLREEWIEQAIKRVQTGTEPAFLASLWAVYDWNPYSLRGVLERIPSTWVEGLATRRALASSVHRMARDHATSLGVYRHYQVLPHDLLLQKTGVLSEDLLRTALDAIAASSLPATSRGLFQLVTILAQFLTPSEARLALSFGLEHLEEALGRDLGDGPWSPHLVPAGNCSENIAGYVWAALGAVESGRRWQAAHAVRALCILGRQSMLANIIALSSARNTQAFTDSRFHFYRMHAIQWLLIALDRASRESGGVVAIHAAWLESLASRGNAHVVLRGIAARALLALADGGHMPMDEVLREALLEINASKLKPKFSPYYARSHHGAAEGDVDCGFDFSYDFSKSWIQSLAQCFAIPMGKVEALASRVIHEDWGLQENGHYDRDARAMSGYFSELLVRRDSALGEHDDLALYLSYHAVMEAAGKILETDPLHEDPDESWGSFSHWLEYKASLDAKGAWLADCRQMPPVDVVAFPAHQEGSWPEAPADDYALSRLIVGGGSVVVAGTWTQYDGKKSETIRVVSALASEARSGALSRALVTHRSSYDYALPEYQDNHEIHYGEFVLEGWTTESGSESGPDSDDPWAGDLARRFPDLAGPLAAELGIAQDEASGKWLQQDGECVAWVERWSEGAVDSDGRAPSGARLVVDKAFLQKILGQRCRTLMCEVICNRQLRPFNYESRSGDVQEERSTSIITLGRSGELCVVGQDIGSRPKTRR